MNKQLVDWQNYIESLRPVADVSNLERVREVADRLSLFFEGKQVVVIGGTNGKGSTALYTESILLSKNVQVGTTTSPHLFRFNERVRINGEIIADHLLLEQFEKVELARRDTPLTYFEFATLIALNVFKEADVETLILEVGLGGRLDATNVVGSDVCAITNIALDHQAVLGSDREQIGYEKAGILRRAVPLVYGESDMPSSVRKRVSELEVPLFQMGRDFGSSRMTPNGWQMQLSVPQGRKTFRFARAPQQPLDFAIASQVVLNLGHKLSQDLLERSLGTSLPGKYEIRETRKRTWILDVAHNPAALKFVTTRLQQDFPEGVDVILFAAKKDKDANEMYKILQSLNAAIICTSTEDDRALKGSELRNLLGNASDLAIDDPRIAINHLMHGTEAGNVILAVGSHELVARVQNALRYD